LGLGKKGHIRVDGQDELQNGQIAASILDDDVILAGLNRGDEWSQIRIQAMSRMK
jgi:hypothetical protein